jgi:inosine-uridine nucleoside N-ribohydrolase
MNLAEHVHGSNGLGGVELPASPSHPVTETPFEQIYSRIKGHPGQLAWANTGSLTNLCILLLCYPDLKDKI